MRRTVATLDQIEEPGRASNEAASRRGLGKIKAENLLIVERAPTLFTFGLFLLGKLDPRFGHFK